jgi:ATP-dependent Lon protease
MGCSRCCRASSVLELLKKEVELCRLQADIGKQVEEKISKDQRRYFLQVRLLLVGPEPGPVHTAALQ